MFLLTEPDESTVAGFLASQANEPFTYKSVGGTGSGCPEKYTVDHNRVELGRGLEVYNQAIDGLRRWRQFDLGWVSIVPEGVPIEEGRVVAVKARAFGSWSLSAARIVYVLNDESPVRRFGFAYGTLTDHVEEGEERFSIELHADETVWYDILAFSRPRHPLVRMAFPLARKLQKRFARESLQRMVREVTE